jgi:hypothetical protein
MLDLYPKIVPILHHTVQEEENTLETVLSIVEGYAARLTHTSSYATSCALTANRFTRYVLVGGQEFLKTHAKQVLGVVEVMLNQSSMAAEQHILSCQIIDILLQLYPQVLCTSCVRCVRCHTLRSFTPLRVLHQRQLTRDRPGLCADAGEHIRARPLPLLCLP